MIKYLVSHLQAKLIFAFVLVLVVPTVFAGAYNFPSTYNQLVTRSIDTALTSNQVQAQAIAYTLKRLKPDAIYLSQTPAIQKYASEVALNPSVNLDAMRTDLVNALRAFLKNLPEYDSIALLNAEGREVVRVRFFGPATAAVIQTMLEDQSQKDYFQKAVILKNEDVYASQVGLNIEANEIEQPYKLVIHISTPIYAYNGSLVGVLVLKFLANTFLDLVKGNSARELAYLANATSGVYLTGPDENKVFSQYVQKQKPTKAAVSTTPNWSFLTDHPQEGAAILASENGSSFGSPDAQGLQQVYTRITVPDFPDIRWTLYRTEPTADIQGNIYRQLSATSVLLLVGLLVAIAIAILLTRSIVRPVQELARVAGAISHGNWNVPVPIITVRDEIGELGKAFSKMSSELKNIYDTLDERVQQRTVELETVVQVSATTTSILDLDQLLRVVVELTKERFNLYHARIFLLSEDGTSLGLAAAAGQDDHVMKEQISRIPIESKRSLVARAVRTHQGVIEKDVTRAPNFLADPILPNNRSEMAVLMDIGEQIIGVLDVQSDEVDHFTDQDVKVLTALAEQVAIAVRNAQLFAQAQESQASAERANQAKSLFLSNMSHELRTPLNAVIGYSSAMLDMPQMYGHQPLADLYTNDIKLIRASGQYLLGLINDILDLSKIESGKFELNLAPADLNEIFKGVISTSLGLVKDKPLQILQDFDKVNSLPLVWADALRIRQILLNLMSNAIKFADTGSVTLSTRLDNNSIRIAVIDTGMGIPKEAQASIFDRYEQVRNKASIQGTGLGLDICQRLAEMHGTKITLESVLGQGSTFSFVLPLATADQIAQGRDSNLEFRDTGVTLLDKADWLSMAEERTILVVEDDTDTRAMLHRVLESVGHVVVDTNDGAQVMELATGLIPDLIILDIGLPNLSGIEILKLLKENPDTSNISVLVLTGDPDYLRETKALGLAHIVDKPTDPAALLSYVQILLAQDANGVRGT